MPIDKGTLMLFGGNAIKEIQAEAHEQGLEQGLELAEQRVEREREKIIMNFWRGMGLTVQDIANVQGWHVQYVQSVIDKFEKGA